VIAKGRKVPGTMNRTEAAYALMLQAKGLSFWYEAITLKLGPDVRYTPDFLVMLPDGLLECHEVKGSFTRDDAKAKFRVAAGLFPFVFRMCVYAKGQWTITTPYREYR
jgi:hypothetical protein